MNPVAKALLGQIANRRIARFVRHWDAIEVLGVRVYRAGAATGDDEASYSQHRTWLLKRYPRWRDALAPYWQGTPDGGEPSAADPFDTVLAAEQASSFVDDWAAMQTLPAAREALNAWLVDMTDIHIENQTR